MIEIRTADMSPEQGALLRLSLLLGERQPTDIQILLVVDSHISCLDGEIFDGFVWRGDVYFGTGFDLTLLESEMVGLTVDQVLSQRHSPFVAG